jgi:hypothetical protein
LLNNLIEKKSLEKFLSIEQEMQLAKDAGDNERYAKLQTELTQAFMEMVTGGLSNNQRDILSNSIKSD